MILGCYYRELKGVSGRGYDQYTLHKYAKFPKDETF